MILRKPQGNMKKCRCHDDCSTNNRNEVLGINKRQTGDTKSLNITDGYDETRSLDIIFLKTPRAYNPLERETNNHYTKNILSPF